ncbi:MAG: leucyl aminopeptidase [Desulfovibrio sp.]|nr:leucyl aminopeptidase [Desulfovibrio sp.]
MELGFQEKSSDWHADIMLVPILEGEEKTCIHPELDKVCPWLTIAPAMRDLQAKEGALTLVHGHPDLPLPRVLFLGLGNRKDLETDTVRTLIGKAFDRCQDLGLTQAAIPLAPLAELPIERERLLEECLYAAALSMYESGFLKKKEPSSPKTCKRLVLCAEGPISDGDRNAAERGRNAARATLLARRLANTPANLLSPDLFARCIVEETKNTSLRCTVLDEGAIERERMGSFLAVAKGSANPPRFVILEHAPEGYAGEPPVVYIGKGICFDSGGISLKPAAKMHQMKSDMSGACAVFSAMLAIASEELPAHIVGILPLAENMPGGRATRPGDVVTALNGETIEITNTDAEGRLILADAISYAKNYFAPSLIIDIATLTGACAVALGDEVAGLFCREEALVKRILDASRIAGEPFWQLPLWKNYAKKLKSDIADICHTGPREGGAINAALFLAHFADDTPFAHLDIAGVDWREKAHPLCPRGATGFGTRTLLELARGGIK